MPVGYLIVGFAHAKCFLYNTTAQWFGPDVTCKRKLSLKKSILSFPFEQQLGVVSLRIFRMVFWRGSAKPLGVGYRMPVSPDTNYLEECIGQMSYILYKGECDNGSL